MFLKLAFKSLIDRRGAVSLSLVAMSVSIAVLIGVEHVRYQIKENFSNTISGVDLVVGARTSSINLLLYSVFRVGSATNNISWESFEGISSDPRVDWSIPISLGDSHKGYSVLGTTPQYFSHFSYGKKRKLIVEKGKPFSDPFDVVLGSDVATHEQYKLGDTIILAHGMGQTSFTLHDKHPFEVVGILEPTGTPVDQTLHVSLSGLEVIHDTPRFVGKVEASEDVVRDIKPENITAFLVGLKSKIMIFKFQNDIANFNEEPLMAILPGVALSELWHVMRGIENALFLVSILVFFSACVGMTAILISSIRERLKEVRLLRVIGAPPSFLFFLIEVEAMLITVTGVVLGSVIVLLLIASFNDQVAMKYGILITTDIWSPNVIKMLLIIFCSSVFSALIPACLIYRSGLVTEID